MNAKKKIGLLQTDREKLKREILTLQNRIQKQESEMQVYDTKLAVQMKENNINHETIRKLKEYVEQKKLYEKKKKNNFLKNSC